MIQKCIHLEKELDTPKPAIDKPITIPFLLLKHSSISQCLQPNRNKTGLN